MRAAALEASDAPACDVDGAHVPLRAGALQLAPQEALRGEQLSKHAKCGWMFIPYMRW